MPDIDDIAVDGSDMIVSVDVKEMRERLAAYIVETKSARGPSRYDTDGDMLLLDMVLLFKLSHASADDLHEKIDTLWDAVRIHSGQLQ